MRIGIKSFQEICQMIIPYVSKYWALSPKMTMGMINCFQIANLMGISSGKGSFQLASELKLRLGGHVFFECPGSQ